jgi:NAD+ synthetase
MPPSGDPHSLRNHILDLSRQSRIRPLSAFLSQTLDRAIQESFFLGEDQLRSVGETIVIQTRAYREESARQTVVLGMSGGVDSALTAALFKRAGYTVLGVTMPIHQDPSETERGVEACNAIGIDHLHLDLSSLYDEFLAAERVVDPELLDGGDQQSVRIRRGNIRARLRMISLYNLASRHNGIVASTDNLSELAAGFWTLHGDVGDFCPIQALTKSWEVPYLARLYGVPESTVRANPTDGLGIDAGDEAQLGCTYLEWDLIIFALDRDIPIPSEADSAWRAVITRMGATWFKRRNPIRLPHPLVDRYEMINAIDRRFFVPDWLR